MSRSFEGLEAKLRDARLEQETLQVFAGFKAAQQLALNAIIRATHRMGNRNDDFIDGAISMAAAVCAALFIDMTPEAEERGEQLR